MNAETFAKLRAQAVLQAKQDASRTEGDPDRRGDRRAGRPVGSIALPAPNPGDVFFDFEGDPLHVADGWGDLGLEYLWGILTHEPAAPAGQPEGVVRRTYWPLWAHDRVAERQALEQFIDWLTARRRQPGFEGLHVYHYAPYEITALKKLVQRYGTRADELDTLLRDGVFVDLYGVVRRSDPGVAAQLQHQEARTALHGRPRGEVTGGAESVVVYAEHRAALAAGEAGGRAEKLLETCAAYNETTASPPWGCATGCCRSAGASPARPRRRSTGDIRGRRAEPPGAVPAQVLAERLRAPLIDLPPAERTPTQQAVAHARRRPRVPPPRGAAHLVGPLPPVGCPRRGLGARRRDDRARPRRITVTEPWHRPKSTWQRTFQAEVDLPGSFKLAPGERKLFAIHDPPLAPYLKPPRRPPSAATPSASRSTPSTPTAMAASSPSPRRCPQGEARSMPSPAFPAAVAVADALEGKGRPTRSSPSSGPARGRGRPRPEADLPPHPALDLLARRPPRLHGADELPPLGDDPERCHPLRCERSTAPTSPCRARPAPARAPPAPRPSPRSWPTGGRWGWWPRATAPSKRCSTR
jgi:hypothetical protein